MKNTDQKSRTRRYGFVLVPEFSLTAFSCAVEALRTANSLAGETLYEVVLIGADSELVRSSCGVEVRVDMPPDQVTQLDALFVCGPTPVLHSGHEKLIAWLRRQSRGIPSLGGIGTGSYLLARAGLLDGYRATIHWLDIATLREAFPRVEATGNLFETDRDRYTCSGGTASMDMLLFLIGREHGMDLASSISEQFVCERIRLSDEVQRVPLKVRLGTLQPNLIEAVTLMEANIEEPLSTDDLAHHVGVSRRHLERLFKQHLQSVPSQYYLELRLDRARVLLRTDDKPILQVGLMCGFSSASYFSTAYRNHFGQTPREERRNAHPPASSPELQSSFGRSFER
ncbi:GlxA family transcriptional regulator [Marinobacterium sedimentorum]|uniref:GlxA family transcriptional regulator n=1 Tax=Marinobacterium sedimentorum TaxID=2927804 RepID=UPI0020C71EE9|nr:GlxA family transcriptional regulator [Marinobacterium sedimentorum]MCP8688885.1 GlxA family transcriptional regulator [Marinobacterium sedimentorum]